MTLSVVSVLTTVSIAILLLSHWYFCVFHDSLVFIYYYHITICIDDFSVREKNIYETLTRPRRSRLPFAPPPI
jgi:hypothetical protein